MMRFAGLSIVFILAVSATQTGAQPQANAPATQNRSVPTENSSERPATAQPPTVDDICRALEEDAAENELPVEFFARVIWQESRFNARAVSRAGAQGIAQFMPRTADWRGLADPFDPIGALRHSASYLRDLRNRFGNLGLAAAGYNAGPGRVWPAAARCRARPAITWRRHRVDADDGPAAPIAQFMPRTADWRGLADPFDPIGALRHSASYLRDLRNRFGNLGLAAAGYNAGPGRVSEWLAGRRTLPSETRNYVAIVTGWTADEWASSLPPETAETTIPQGLPCTRLANLILAPKEEAQRIAGYVPRWGAQLTSNWSESRAWATYRALQKQYASLIGDREPIVLHGRLPGMGSATRYIIRIGDDNRAYLEKLCAKLIAAGGACVVLRNGLGRG